MTIYCSKAHPNPTENRFCQYCGEKLLSPVINVINSGIIIGDRYRIIKEIDNDSLGNSYLAEDINRVNETCILKEFVPQIQNNYAVQKAAELFNKKANILDNLKHSQISNFRELLHANQIGKIDKLFIVQDYIEGETYSSILKTRKHQKIKFSEIEILEILRQILPVLEYIHNLGIIHRNIAPKNIVLRNIDKLPVLINLGSIQEIITIVNTQFNQNVSITLTNSGYAPQEQIQTGIVAPHTDLYALAATLLVLLTAKEPQQLMNPDTLNWDWQSEISLSPTLSTILHKMLANNPGDRYQSAAEILQQLNQTSSIAKSPNPGKKIPTYLLGCIGCIGKTLLILLLIFSTANVGWWLGHLWVKSSSEQKNKLINPSNPNPLLSRQRHTTSLPQLAADKKSPQDILSQRRRNLGINANFFVKLVNSAFLVNNPTLKTQSLQNDAQKRQKIAAQLLYKLEKANLTTAARQKMGSYNAQDRQRWQTTLNKKYPTNQAFYKGVNAQYVAIFPEYSPKKLKLTFEQFLDQPMGQVWQAIASDKIKAISN